MKLTELNPRISPAGGAYQTLIFACPKCRKHEIAIDVRPGPSGDVEVPMNGLPPGQERLALLRIWHMEEGTPGGGWPTWTITPSIDRAGRTPPDSCGGWHGHITNGQIVGGI